MGQDWDWDWKMRFVIVILLQKATMVDNRLESKVVNSFLGSASETKAQTSLSIDAIQKALQLQSGSSLCLFYAQQQKSNSIKTE